MSSAGAFQDPALIEARIEELIDELFTSHDVTEAEECIVDMRAPDMHDELARQLMAASMERSQRERALVVRLLASPLLTDQHLTSAFRQLAEVLDELHVDVPYAPLYYGQFLGGCIARGGVSLSSLSVLIDPTISNGMACKVNDLGWTEWVVMLSWFV